MTIRETIMGAYVVLACLSCVRNKPAEQDAGATASSASARPTTAGSAPESSVPAKADPKTLAYDDKNDLPANAGDARCKDPIGANAKPASVKLELTGTPPGIEMSIPSLGVRQKLWPGATNPTECRASLEGGGVALRFRCSDDETAVDGKIYARRSDVLIGRMSTAGAGTSKFVLPCGTTAKLEPIACPKECKNDGDRCTCGTQK
jgi:hypothetical protein